MNNPKGLSFADFRTLLSHAGWTLDHQTGSHQIWYSPTGYPDTIVRARIELALKDEANRLFQRMGLTMSEAIRLFLHQAVTEQALPFAIEVPNATTLAAMSSMVAPDHRLRLALDGGGAAPHSSPARDGPPPAIGTQLLSGPV